MQRLVYTFFKLCFTSIALGTVFTFSNCSWEHDCEGFDLESNFFAFSMFRSPSSELYFVGETDTLILTRVTFEYSEPVTLECSSLYPCKCSENFEAIYFLGDTLSFSSRFYGSYMRTTVADSSLLLSARAEPPFLDFMRPYIKVNNVVFEDVMDLQYPNQPIDRVIIKQNKGLVAIRYQGELFLRKQPLPLLD